MIQDALVCFYWNCSFLRNARGIIGMWGYTAIALGTGIVILIAIIYICGKAVVRMRAEGTAYADAMRRSGETGKRLVVLGDPSRGWFGSGYGGGDICLKRTDVGWFAEQPDDSAVVFVDESVAMAEVERVAGDSIFYSQNHRPRKGRVEPDAQTTEQASGKELP